MTILLAQFGMLLFAIFSAIEEAAFTHPFRKISNEAFPDKTKFQLLRKAHTNGALQVGMILFVIGVLSGFFAAVLAGLVYWLVFDISFAIATDQHPLKIGDTANLDKLLTKVLGKNAGAKK